MWDAEPGPVEWGPEWLEDVTAPARPLLRPVPRSAMFFPMVVVVAVLPGLYALNWWDLNAPGPWWGFRGLVALEGHLIDQTTGSGLGTVSADAMAYREVAMQPPLYAWLEAICFRLIPDRDPVASVLPSYAAGALVVILMYLHGRLWRGRGIGLTAAIVTGFNRELLIQMQQASPTTLGLAGMLASLLCYGQSLTLTTGEGMRRLWSVLGGLALGLAILSVGLFALLVLPVVLVHQLVLAIEPAHPEPGRWWRAGLTGSNLGAGTLALTSAALIAVPWFVRMLTWHGGEFLAAQWAPGQSLGGGSQDGLIVTLLNLAPALLPIGLLGVARSVRQVLAVEGDAHEAVGLALWIVWLAVAAIMPVFWPSGPIALSALCLLMPLNLLAAQALYDLSSRRIASRHLIWLAPLTALSVSWWLSADLRDAVASVRAGQRVSGEMLFKLHLGLDLIIILAFATRFLDHWARSDDGRRRVILAVFLLGTLAVTVGSGLREVRFRHDETAEVLDLRDTILRRQHIKPFTQVEVVDPLPARALDFRPAGRLWFMLRATLPNVPPEELERVDALRWQRASGPADQRLVIVVGGGEALSYRDQSRLGLEALLSGTTTRERPSLSNRLEAFATAFEPPQPRHGRH